MINFLKKYWLLIAVFIIFAFLRFYNLDQRIIFDWDQEQYSYQVKNIVENRDFVLIGPRANNDRGFFLGPYFIYILIPFYLLKNLHPSALIDFIFTYNLLFFISSFLVISKLFSKKHALIFLLLWSINSLVAQYDVIPWNPLLIPLGVLLVWLILEKVYRKDDYKNFVLLGLILGFFSNLHFQFIFLILFSGVFLLLSYKKINLFKLKNLFAFASSFLIIFLPLLVFDIRHNFLNTRLFFAFFTEDNPALVNDRNVWVVVFSNFLKPFIYKENLDLMWLFMFVIAGMVVYLIRNKNTFTRNFYISFLTIFLFTPLIFYFYGTRSSEYYFFYLIPFVLITIADFFFTLKKQYLIILLVFFMMAINNVVLKRILKPIPIGLFHKDKAVKTLKNNIDFNKKFNVTIDAPLGFHNGYKYLLDWYKIPQSGNFEDPLIQIKLPPENVDIRINDGIGLIIPKEVRK